MTRGSALAALAVLAASGAGAQPVEGAPPRYEGFRIPDAAALRRGGDFPPLPSGGGREGGDLDERVAAASEPAPCSAHRSPLAPPVQGVDVAGPERPFAVVLADTTGAPPDDWLGRDKALHLGASFLITLSGQYVLVDKADLSNGRALPVSAGVALALGLAKEVADSRRPRHPLFSWRDLAADAAGVALAAAVTAW